MAIANVLSVVFHVTPQTAIMKNRCPIRGKIFDTRALAWFVNLVFGSAVYLLK